MKEKEKNRIYFKNNYFTHYRGSNRYIDRVLISNNSIIETNTNDYVAGNFKEKNNNNHSANLKNDTIVVASDYSNRIEDTRVRIIKSNNTSGKMNHQVKTKRYKRGHDDESHDLSSVYEEEQDMDTIPTRLRNESLGTARVKYANNIRTAEYQKKKDDGYSYNNKTRTYNNLSILDTKQIYYSVKKV